MNFSPESSKLQEHYDKVLDLPDSEREKYIQTLAATDPALAREVQRLVNATESGLEVEPVFHFDDDLMIESLRERAFEDGEQITTPIGSARVLRLISDALRIGQTEVYEVILDKDERRIALKVLRSETSAGDIRRRFRVEALSHSKLNHSGIASMLGAGPASGASRVTHASIAMAFVDGETLDQWVEDRDVVPDAVAVIADIARTVHFANLRGIVHRDLKPQNIMVDREGHPCLLDLGVAKLTDPAETGIGQSLISVGETVVGTPRYMAPEQFTPTTQTIDLRADVYALGCILYELITGQPPVDVEGLSTVETADAKRTATITEPRIPGVPRDLIRCAVHACAATPSDRYESCQALAIDIERAVKGLPLLERPPGAGHRFRLLVRRHPKISLMILLTIGIMISYGVIYVKLQQRIVVERDRAIARFDETRSFANWVIFHLDRNLSARPGTAETRRQLIERASSTLDALTADPVADDALLMDLIDARLRIADVLRREMGNRPLSDKQLKEAIFLLGQLDDPSTPDAKVREAWVMLWESYTSYVPIQQRMQHINLQTVEVFREYEEEFADHPTFWRWRAEAEWRATRRLLDRNATAEEILALARDAVAHADRSVYLDPGDPFNLAEAANTRFWLAHAMFDLDHPDSIKQTDIAIEAAESLAKEYAHVGNSYVARGKSLKGKILLSKDDFVSAIDLIKEAVEIHREVVAADPSNFYAFRLFEVSNVWLAETYLHASQAGMPELAVHGLQHIRSAMEHHARRIELGWILPEEGNYPDDYRTLEQQLLDIAGEASPMP